MAMVPILIAAVVTIALASGALAAFVWSEHRRP
jgi:hypothetical protein